MNFDIPTEYAIAGMVLLPLLIGILIWIIKDKQLQQLNQQPCSKLLLKL